jgi:hypothetical protein
MLCGFEPLAGNCGNQVRFDVLAREQKIRKQVRSAGGHLAGKEITPHLVVRIDRRTAAVILVDAHGMLARGAAGLQYLVEVREEALRFLLVFRHAAAWRRCVDDVGRHACEIGRALVSRREHPAPRAHPGRVANAPRFDRDGKQRSDCGLRRR